MKKVDGLSADDLMKASNIVLEEFGLPKKIVSDASVNFVSDHFKHSWLLLVYLFCISLMTHLGYLHLTRASQRCSNSSLRSSGVVHTVLALWVRVPMTLYLADRLLSHCKYLSVWMGLWYTAIEREWSTWGMTKVSKKGIAPLSWLPSTVNVDQYSSYDPKILVYWPVVE